MEDIATNSQMDGGRLMRAVMALSGGMDSTGLLVHLLSKGYNVSCISYEYGQKHNIELERAKAIEALRRSILEAKEELRFELANLEKKQRAKERKEMMKQVEISRSRNISHKGEKYSINFGYVIEASP